MEQFREFEVEGQRLAASIHIPGAVPAPAVVMCHGFTGDRVEAHFLFVKAARAFCAAGLNVLRFDFRGSGESDGRFRDMTINAEIEDATAAIKLVRSEETVDPERVALLGLSLGGLVSACTAGRGGDIAALALWSAVADIGEIIRERWHWQTDPGRIDIRGYYERGAHQVGARFVLDALRIRPLEEIAGHEAPVLVIHGTEDAAVPIGHAQRYMDAAVSTDSTLRIIDGSDHTFTSVAWEEEVIGRTTAWLTDRLGVEASE